MLDNEETENTDYIPWRGRSPSRAAEIIGCGRTKVYEEIRGGRLKAKKLGRLTIITDGNIREYMDSLPAMEV